MWLDALFLAQVSSCAWRSGDRKNRNERYVRNLPGSIQKATSSNRGLARLCSASMSATLCDLTFAEVTMSRIAVFIACAILLVLALPEQASARRGGGGFRGGGFRGGGFRGGVGRGFRGGRRGIAWRGGRGWGRRGRVWGWGAAAAVAALPYYGITAATATTAVGGGATAIAGGE